MTSYSQRNIPTDSNTVISSLTNNKPSTTMNLTQTKTFANAARHDNYKYPNKKQGILLNTIDEINPNEFLYAVGDIVGPRNIIFISKISNQRICIFLSTKELVDEIVTQHGKIIVGNHEVEVRRYVNTAKRIVISNVCPTIPHSVIENVLVENDIKMVSPISFLRAGVDREEYKHIMSFRRQVFATINDDKPIPDSLVINHDETNYRIFLSTDITCFTCKQKGHTANKCTNATGQTINDANKNCCEDTYTPTNTTHNDDQNTPMTSKINNELPTTTIKDVEPKPSEEESTPQKAKGSLQLVVC